MRVVIGVLALLMLCVPAFSHDDGRYAQAPLKNWFDSLSSGHGPCCSFADGITIKDVDYDTRADPDGTNHYWVFVWDTWVKVDDDAVLTVPNKFGSAVVWPWRDGPTEIHIRCFMPGAGG